MAAAPAPTSNIITRMMRPAFEPLERGIRSSSSSRRTLPVSNDDSSLGDTRTRPANAGSSGIAASLPTYGPEGATPVALIGSLAHIAVLRPSGPRGGAGVGFGGA